MDCIMSSFVLLLLVLIKCSQADIQLSGSAVLVSRVSRLVCKSDVNLSRYPGRMVAYHQWNQVYDAKPNHFIANLPAIEALNTQLTIYLEKFDNNTDVYSSFSVHNASNGNQLVFNHTIHCSGVEAWINLLDDGFYDYQIDYVILNYNMTTQATFSCQAYSHLSDNIQVGWINTVTNKIFMYNLIKTELTLTASHNATILCCIYYTVNGDKNGYKHIRRFVKDKTLLIHQEKLPIIKEPSGKSTKSYCGNTDAKLISNTTCILSPKADGRNPNTNEKGNTSTATNEPGKGSNATNMSDKTSNATNVPGKNSNTTNERGKNSYAANVPDKDSNATNEPDKVTNETDKNLNPPDKTDSSDHDTAANSNSNFIIIISSISASLLVLLVVIYVIHKRCPGDTKRRERPQLPLPQTPSQRSADELDPNSPFYLNLLFRKECQLEIQAREEPQYEEIMYH